MYDGPIGIDLVAVPLELEVADDVGGMRLITYESAVTLKSGPHGVSVVAAPPAVAARFEDHGPQAGAGEVGRRRRDRCVPTDDDRVECFDRHVLLVVLLGRCGRPSLRNPKGAHCTGSRRVLH